MSECVLGLASTLLKAAGSPAPERKGWSFLWGSAHWSARCGWRHRPLISPTAFYLRLHPLLFSHPVTGGQARISGAALHERIRAPSSPSLSERGQCHHPTRGQRSPTCSSTPRGPSHRRRAACATTRHRHLRGAAVEREHGSVVRSGDAGGVRHGAGGLARWIGHGIAWGVRQLQLDVRHRRLP